MMKNVLCILFCLAFFNTSSAQKVQIKANAKSITTDDALVISIELVNPTGSIRAPRWPQIPGLVPGMPQQGTYQVNHHRTVSFSMSYFAEKPGTYSIPRISFRYDGKSYNLDPFQLKVTQGTGKPSISRNDPFADMQAALDEFFGGGSRMSSGFGPQPQLKFEDTEAEYFLSVEFSKDTCYVGEQLLLEVVLYVAKGDEGKVLVDGYALQELQERVAKVGFWQEMFEFNRPPRRLEVIDGKEFVGKILYRAAAFPINPGEISLNEIYVDGQKLAVATNASEIQQLMGKNAKYKPITIKAAPKQLVVLPLPPTNLPNANLVGRFQLEGAMDKDLLNTGESVGIGLRIRGTGNIAMMPDPETGFPESFEADKPQSEFTKGNNGTTLLGEKYFRYYLVPKKAGRFNLGPMKMYYFDPEKEAYDSLQTGDILVRVEGEDLETKMIKAQGVDPFFEERIKSTDADPQQAKGFHSWMLFAGLGVVLVASGYAVVTARKTADAPEVVERDDFWRS